MMREYKDYLIDIITAIENAEEFLGKKWQG